jgi:asparagine synthase (glutamine-hydrolysing)
VADVPLGAFLSGGIDSTLVVGLMRERVEGPLRTFSLGFADDPNYDETPFARMAAERFGTEHTEFTVEARAVELVDELVDAYDEPFGDSSAIPTHIVSGLTRAHVTVALTGDGGDEMFCGYPRLVGMEAAERVGVGAARVGHALARRLPHRSDFRHPLRRVQRFFAAAALPPEERMLRWIGYLPEVERFLRPELRAGVDRAALTESFRAPWRRFAGESALARAMALTFETYLPDDLLVKADRCSMAHGLELRAPFLDTAVMTFAAGLPDRLRRRGRTLKWLLKHAFTDLLPPPIRTRAKWGFGVPLPLWFRTRWKPLFEGRVLAPDARLWRWLERAPVDALWNEHQAATADHGHALWALLTLETWLRRRLS